MLRHSIVTKRLSNKPAMGHLVILGWNYEQELYAVSFPYRATNSLRSGKV